MRTLLCYITVALIFSVLAQQWLPAATPGQAYHRTPNCIDGNCVPNRPTTGYHATRWRPWPEGEPSLVTPIPPVGIDLNKTSPPSRDKELELPVRPTAPGENISTEPSPNDRPSGGVVLPNELRDVTPKKPVEVPLPSSGGLNRGPLIPGSKPMPSIEPMLLGKKPQPLRSLPLESPPNHVVPAEESPALLKIRPVGNTQTGLMPEMVPWNDEEKNPVVRQEARILGNRVQHTISLEETALPDANAANSLTIRVQHESSAGQSIPTSAMIVAPNEAKSLRISMAESSPQVTEVRSAANAPAILPSVEARPLPAPIATESVSSSPAAASPLRGVSQGNPLRR